MYYFIIVTFVLCTFKFLVLITVLLGVLSHIIGLGSGPRGGNNGPDITDLVNLHSLGAVFSTLLFLSPGRMMNVTFA